eukprot:GFYU01005962.1.p1 GENE.GFYU01005962.1~~GFYU01005962.1.p1  ORF type:complete len:380 (-),score=92.11 GFYU01005962.1:250-1326(-)
MVDVSDKPQIIEHIHKSLGLTVFDTKWVPSSARFVLLGQHPRNTGALQVYHLNHGKLDVVQESEKKDGFKCGTFHASSVAERHLATGDFAGRMSIWDLDRAEMPIYSVEAHSTIVNCIDGVGGLRGQGAPEIVTSSRDGCVRVWDPRQKDKPVAALEPAEGETARDSWAVAFGHAHNDSDRCVAAGYDNGDVKLWDLKTNTLRWETNLKNGVCSLEFDRRDIDMNKLVVTTLESKFHVYDMRTYHQEKEYANLEQEAHKSTVWLARHLPQNRDVFMTCGGNGSLNLWKYNYPSQRSVLDEKNQAFGIIGNVEMIQEKNLSTQPIASFDWNLDKEGLCVMGSFDQSIRVGIVTKTNLIN